MLPAVYICGDVHLSGEPAAFHAFLDRLLTRPPARLVILGDLFEYWLDTDASVRRYRPCLRRLRALAAAGWRLDLVIGNREMAAGRRLGAATRCRLHWPALDLVLGARVVRVVHGDRLCRDPGYHFLFAMMNGFWTRVWRRVLPEWFQEGVARWARRLSRRRNLARRRRRQASGASEDMLDPRRVRGAARRADLLVAGHIHRQWRRSIGGVDLILAGDWARDEGRWVELDAAGAATLHHHRLRPPREV